MKLPHKLIKWAGPKLIARAKKTPYSHINDYMERYWLVPYKDPKAGVGCGPVKFSERPFTWLLQQFDVAVRVHHILRSDHDRALHDHPWRYVTVILKHGYDEVTLEPGYSPRDAVCARWFKQRWRLSGEVLYRPANSFHRLIVFQGLEPWTLFITGRKQQTWGFMTPKGKIPYKEYLKEGA